MSNQYDPKHNPSGAPVPPAPPGPPTAPGRGGDEAVATIVPYRNMPALLAYYFGVFSLIPCLGLPLSVAAIVLGIIGLLTAAKNPGAHGRVHAIVGIVLGLVTSIGYGALFIVLAATA